MFDHVKFVQDGHPDLTHRQMAMLLLIARDGKGTVRGLAAELGLKKGVTSRAATSLATMGLVRRVPDITDARSVFIVPTPKAGSRTAQSTSPRALKSKPFAKPSPATATMGGGDERSVHASRTCRHRELEAPRQEMAALADAVLVVGIAHGGQAQRGWIEPASSPSKRCAHGAHFRHRERWRRPVMTLIRVAWPVIGAAVLIVPHMAVFR